VKAKVNNAEQGGNESQTKESGKAKRTRKRDKQTESEAKRQTGEENETVRFEIAVSSNVHVSEIVH